MSTTKSATPIVATFSSRITTGPRTWQRRQYGPPGPGEDRTSFHGLPRWVFKRAAAEITLAFRRYPQFRGLAVDDVDSYMAAGP